MSVHVRWPAKNSGAFVFGLNFWFFWFKPKEQKKKSISLSKDLKTTFLFFVLKGDYIPVRPNVKALII
jgi:hypothetical protein